MNGKCSMHGRIRNSQIISVGIYEPYEEMENIV
jgi:hypothetical protein